tara:strand:- start:11892 stop:13475 length:1584 start_codon:yes stop_codon:yes gene_type:complete
MVLSDRHHGITQYLPKNVELKKVHGVFLSKNLFKSKRLYVALEWKNGYRSSLPIEMANLAAPGRTFSGKEVRNEVKYERIIATISQLKNIDKSSNHYLYYYETNKGLISFSGFELARTIFFHNRHLVHAAYTANGLAGLAFVDKSISPVTISFPDSTRYPESYVRTQQAVDHIAWLFLDPEARVSFFSIYQCFQENSNSIDFKFTPPDLTGWKFELSVINNENLKVLEVQRVENILDAHVNKKYLSVEVVHPKKKKKDELAVTGEGKPRTIPSDDIDPELDMGEIPGFGRRLHTQRVKGFSFYVSGIQGVFLSDGKEADEPTPVFKDKKSPEPEKAGVGMPESGGNGQEFDPVINQYSDTFDEAEEQPSKFLMFEKVINELGKLKGIKLKSIKCGVFPVPLNNSKVIFNTKDKQRLRFFIAILDICEAKVIILEADTSSLLPPKGGGTLLLGLKDDANTNFKEIIQHFSDSAAQWQHDYIWERANVFKSCNHPKTRKNGELLSESEYAEKWVISLKKQINKALGCDL